MGIGTKLFGQTGSELPKYAMRNPGRIHLFNARAERLERVFNYCTEDFYNLCVVEVSYKEWKFLERRYKKCEELINEIARKSYPNQRDLNHLATKLQYFMIPTIKKCIEKGLVTYDEVSYDYAEWMIQLDGEDFYYLGYAYWED